MDHQDVEPSNVKMIFSAPMIYSHKIPYKFVLWDTPKIQ